jgi:hypothetical protein
MEEVFDRDALDHILFHKFRDDMPNMAAAWKILRQWTLGEEIFQLLLERGTLAHASERCAAWVFPDGSSVTVTPGGGMRWRTACVTGS